MDRPDGLPPQFEEARARALRLTPDRALGSLDEAEEFLQERGMLTLTHDGSLPSLFGACHDEPLAPGRRGYGTWPRTKWWWGDALAERPGVFLTKLHGGKCLYLSSAVAARVSPLCARALREAERDPPREESGRVLSWLRRNGPSLADRVRAELDFDRRTFHAARERLERYGAIVGWRIRSEEHPTGHRHETALARWDQVRFPGAQRQRGGSAAEGDGEEALLALYEAGVRAAVAAPESEVATWFTWPPPAGAIDRLVAVGRVARPAPGWLAAAEK